VIEEMTEGLENPDEDDTVEEDNGDLFTDIYVETATNLLHEVHMFETFCLVRLASPNFFADVRKLNHVDFSREFHEYGGDPQAVRDYLRSASADILVE
jgi:hypothetical protein